MLCAAAGPAGIEIGIGIVLELQLPTGCLYPSSSCDGGEHIVFFSRCSRAWLVNQQPSCGRLSSFLANGSCMHASQALHTRPNGNGV